ncbi:oligosaccharide flippase family protein [Bacteroidota bacterium]
MSFLRKFTGDAVVYGLGKGIKKFIGFFLLPFYARALSPAEYGILETLGTFIFFIVVFLNLGLDSASGFYFFQPHDDKERGRILFTVFIIRLLTIVPAIILSLFSEQISILLFNSTQYTTVVLVTCLLLPVNVITSEQELIYRFNRQPWKYNILTIIKSLFNITAGIILVVKLDFGVLGAQLASLLSGLAVVIFSFLIYTRKKYTYEFSFAWAKKLLRYGFPLIFAGIAVWVYQSSDRYFLLYYQNLTDIGYYSIGSKFSQPLGIINMAVQMSWGVLFYEIYNREKNKEKVESKNALTTLVKFYVTTAVVLSFVLSLYSKEIVGLVATEKFLPGITVIPVLLFSAILAQLIQIIGVGITISERTIIFTYIIIVSALVNLGLNFVFVPLLSFYGAALTTLIAYFVNLILHYRFSQKYFRVHFEMAKLVILFFIFLIVSTIIPYFEINGGYMFSLPLKILVFSIMLFVPFGLKLIAINDIKKILNIS